MRLRWTHYGRFTQNTFVFVFVFGCGEVQVIATLSHSRMASAATGDAAPGGSPSPKKEENVRIISIEEQAAIFAGLHHKKFGLREVGCLPRFIAQVWFGSFFLSLSLIFLPHTA